MKRYIKSSYDKLIDLQEKIKDNYIFDDVDSKTMNKLKSVALSAEIDTKNELNKAFYRIPDVESELLSDLTIRITFDVSSDDVDWFTPKRIKEALSKYGMVEQNRIKLLGCTNFTYDITCDFVSEYEGQYQ